MVPGSLTVTDETGRRRIPPLITNHPPLLRHASSPFDVAVESMGRARDAGPRPGERVFSTVSTLADVPRGRFPRALRLAALRLGPSRIVPTPLLTAGVGADLPVLPGAVRPKARGEQAATSNRRRQGPPRLPAPGLHRSTTAPPTSGRWIRRPPLRRVCRHHTRGWNGARSSGARNAQSREIISVGGGN